LHKSFAACVLVWDGKRLIGTTATCVARQDGIIFARAGQICSVLDECAPSAHSKNHQIQGVRPSKPSQLARLGVKITKGLIERERQCGEPLKSCALGGLA